MIYCFIKNQYWLLQEFFLLLFYSLPIYLVSVRFSYMQFAAARFILAFSFVSLCLCIFVLHLIYQLKLRPTEGTQRASDCKPAFPLCNDEFCVYTISRASLLLRQPQPSVVCVFSFRFY